NFLLRDKTQYFGPVTENDSPVDKYSYLGYSVTTGFFFGDYVSYVGGAPRSNGTGQVVFFSRAKIGESLLVVDLVLDGEMFASSFGFEVLGLDINRDGLVAYLKSGSRDLLRPLRFKLSYEIIQRTPSPSQEGRPLPNIDDFPILDQQEAVKIFHGHFVKECGDDDICNSDLHTEAHLRLPYDKSKSHQVFELGLRNVALLEASVTNSGDPAYEPSLFVEHHDSMAFSIKESDTGSYLCVPVRADLVHCTLGNPLTNSTGPLLLAFKPSGFFDKRFIRFKVFANSTSNERTPQDNIDLVLEILKRAEVSITGSVEPEQVFFSGDVVGETGVTSIEAIGAEVVHKYVVDNKGPWRVDSTEVEVLWPYQVENFMPQGKWLLYLVNTPTVDGDGECEVDPKYVNPVGLPWKRSPIYSPFEDVAGEAEVTTVQKPPTPAPVVGQPEDAGTLVSSQSSNRTTINKTISTSSTVNTVRSETSKTTKEDKSVSSSSVHESHSSGDDEYYDYDYGDEYGQPRHSNPSNVGPVGTRTHSRVSRRDYSIRTRSRNQDNNLFGEELPESVSRLPDTRQDNRPLSERDRSRDSSSGRDQYDRTVTSYRTSSGSNRLDGDRSRDWSRTDGDSRYVDPLSFSEGRRSGWSSSTKREKSTRIHSTSESGEIPSRRFGSERSNFNERNDISDRIGEVDAAESEDGTRYESRTFDGGRGREVRKWSSNSYTDPDGSLRTEDKNELHRTHTSVSPHSEGSEDLRNTSRSEQSRRIYTSKVSSSTNSRDGMDRDWEGSRSNDGYRERAEVDRYASSVGGGDDRVRFSSFDDRSRHEDSSNPSLDRDSGWRSRTFDGGRGREDRRRTSTSSTGEDGSRTRHEKTEIRRTHSESYYNPEWNDRNVDSRKTEYSKRVSSSRTSTNVGTDQDSRPGSGVHGQTYDSRDRTNYRPSISSSHPSNNAIDADTDSVAQSSGSSSTFAGRASSGYNSEPVNENSLDVSHRRTYSPFEEDSNRSHHTYHSSRTVTSSDNILPRTEARWRSGGFRKSGTDDNTPSSSGNPSSSRSGENSWSIGSDRTSDSSRSNSRGGANRISDHSENLTWSITDDRSQGLRNGWSTSGSQGSSRSISDDKSSHDTDDDYEYYDYENEIDGDHNPGKTFTRTEIDGKTGEAKVYSRRDFDGQASQWREVDSLDPLKESSSRGNEFLANTHNNGELRHSLRRVKRDKEMVVQPEAFTDDQTGRTLQAVTLRCTGDVPTAKCIPIRCTIRNLGAESSASIRIVSRLWNATLVEDYAHVNLVNVQSRGELLLPEDIRSRQDESDDVAVAETKAYANLLEQPQSVPLWVILVSVFAGLLLLALIILILCKMGFFERKRPDPTLSGNLSKNGY
ncbi:uncharacterized protein LOC108670618, partial [Hyalella azteca]|uniref:Uncharacterized protein LOC108670618 n=1 Tax=Hyalella azteca TaxID=294128 RepID=A0A979FPJ3_HYAAZ